MGNKTIVASDPLLLRLWQYQLERFPLAGHGLMVAAFSFSAIAYSRICRGAAGFVPSWVLAGGVFMAVTLFLLVRIFDEFKDREEDAQFRPYLPVPRGLVTLSELKVLGLVTAAVQILVQWWLFPSMLPFYLLVMGYLALMGKEFFIADWLKARPFFYVTSHMFIIPLVDVYASGLDWHLAGVMPHFGLAFFFVVSYFNGIVLEVGRKIRAPEAEEFNTYSTMLGVRKAVLLWLAMLVVTLGAALAAAWYAGHGWLGIGMLCLIFAACAAQGILMLQKATPARGRRLGYASVLWTIAMYFLLGGIPMLLQIGGG